MYSRIQRVGNIADNAGSCINIKKNGVIRERAFIIAGHLAGKGRPGCDIRVQDELLKGYRRLFLLDWMSRIIPDAVTVSLDNEPTSIVNSGAPEKGAIRVWKFYASFWSNDIECFVADEELRVNLV